jgi:hypothetical protein
MIYRILAETTLVIHFIWIVFLVIGGLWGRKYFYVAVVHIGGLAFAVVMQAARWYCPLTQLEFWFRRMNTPEAGFEGSFIIHYLEKFVYPDVSLLLIFVLTIVLCVVNALLYGTMFKHKKD